MATISNLFIDAGSDFSVQITLENDDGTVMNLETFTAYSQFRKSYTSSTAYSFTTTIDVENGVVTLSLPADYSSTIPPGRYLYDAELRNVGGTVIRFIEGVVTVSAEITRIPVSGYSGYSGT